MTLCFSWGKGAKIRILFLSLQAIKDAFLFLFESRLLEAFSRRREQGRRKRVGGGANHLMGGMELDEEPSVKKLDILRFPARFVNAILGKGEGERRKKTVNGPFLPSSSLRRPPFLHPRFFLRRRGFNGNV